MQKLLINMELHFSKESGKGREVRDIAIETQNNSTEWIDLMFEIYEQVEEQYPELTLPYEETDIEGYSFNLIKNEQGVVIFQHPKLTAK